MVFFMRLVNRMCVRFTGAPFVFLAVPNAVKTVKTSIRHGLRKPTTTSTREGEKRVSRSKQKGTTMETWTVRYLAWALQDTRIDRMSLHGTRDKGDLIGVMHHGHPVCVEVKDTKTPDYEAHWQEVETEMGNMDTEYGVLVQHRKGYAVKSLTGMGCQMAIMTPYMLDKFIEDLSATAQLVYTTCSQPLAHARLVWIPLSMFALILNDLQPLGPDVVGEDHQ